jgi:hypothetical protein
MPTQPAPGVAQVRMRYLYDNERCENIYHVMKATTTAYTLAELEDIASTFIAWEDTTASLNRPTDVQMVEVIVTDLISLAGLRVTRTQVPSINGAIPTDSLPNSSTFAIKAEIGNRGRGMQGRTFWIGLVENQVSANTVNPTYRDDIVSSMESLRTSVEALVAGYHLAVLHKRANGAPLPVGVPTRVTSWSATDLTVDSQRTRLPGHRRQKRRVIP